MKKKATHRFNPQHKIISDFTNEILNTMVWFAGSHGVFTPKVVVPFPVVLKPTDKVVIRNTVANVLISNTVNWQLILVAAFDSKEQRSYVTANIELGQWDMLEVGSRINEICEVTIRKMEEVFYGEGAVNLTNIHHYAYALSPTMGLDVEVMEDSLIDALDSGSFEHYDWKSRPKITPKNFIDSISEIKI